MLRLTKKVSETAGLAPGTLVHVGEKRSDKVSISVIDYKENLFQEKELKSVDECQPFKSSSTVSWLNINGIHDTKIIEKIGQQFELHPLIMEDIVNTSQRPKMEDFKDYMFIVLKMLYHDDKINELKSEQVSIVFFKNAVISFQEIEGDVFDSVRDRIRNNKGKVRKSGADYLMYALLDAIVDNYFIILEKLGERVEIMEEELVLEPTPKTLHIIHELKRELIQMRKSVWPLREMIGGLQRSESLLIQKTTNIYLRDVYDHTIQVIDTLESFRDMVSGMMDIYLSSVSNKMNEVMKVLTIIATIFIPLTFIAGIYGMNFKYMPELGWKYGYAGIWGIILVIVATMVVYFKRKKWM